MFPTTVEGRRVPAMSEDSLQEALFRAIQKSDLAAAAALLDRGAEVNAREALHAAGLLLHHPVECPPYLGECSCDRYQGPNGR